ncbi:MAG: hypothetical protein JWN40_4409 [Phycisphaerales bacterium]|nr:hypothetical protein [Phycisphaerales bacterium]
MSGRAKWVTGMLAVTAMFFVAPGARACTIPVFRYALERWAASPYEVVVFAKGELGDADRAVLEELTKKPVNVAIRTVDVSGDMSPEHAAIWKNQRNAQLPWVVVRFPESGEQAPLVWTGKLDKTALAEQLDSPARRELARRLLAGQSCVWVLLESGDKAKDDHLAAKLDETLKRVANTIELPEIAADGPQLHSPLPLKLEFSILRLARTDTREAALVKMLRVAEPELADSDEALVIPVVGRGRAISALAAPRVNDQGVGAFAQFICGQCSCEVKELNPGIDLLLAADWNVIFGDRQVERDEPAVAEAGKSVPIPVSTIAMPTTAPAAIDAMAGTYISFEHSTYNMGRQWLIGGIVLAAAAVLVSGGIALRARRK